MISLLIDTSVSNLYVSIVKDHAEIASSFIEDCIGHSTKLLVEIDKTIQKAKLDLSSIDTLFVVSGPGSFTGLRVGLSVMKTMAYAADKKLIPISSLEFMATTPFEGDYIVPYIDARRGYVYAGMYDKEGNIVRKDCYIKVEDLIKELPSNKKVVFAGYTDVSGIDTYINVKAIPSKITKKHIHDEVKNVHSINPNYLKRTEAEEKKDGTVC